MSADLFYKCECGASVAITAIGSGLNSCRGCKNKYAASLAGEVRLWNPWTAAKNRLPEDGLTVNTKILDEAGSRNEQPLKKMKNLWFYPDGSAYVYYTPTHWQSL